MDDDAWKKARREFGGVCQQSRFCIENARVTDGRSRRLPENASRTLGEIFKLAEKNAFLIRRISLAFVLNTRKSTRAAVSQIDTGKLTRRFLESSRVRGNPERVSRFSPRSIGGAESGDARRATKLLEASARETLGVRDTFLEAHDAGSEGVPSR